MYVRESAVFVSERAVGFLLPVAFSVRSSQLLLVCFFPPCGLSLVGLEELLLIFTLVVMCCQGIAYARDQDDEEEVEEGKGKRYRLHGGVVWCVVVVVGSRVGEWEGEVCGEQIVVELGGSA